MRYSVLTMALLALSGFSSVLAAPTPDQPEPFMVTDDDPTSFPPTGEQPNTPVWLQKHNEYRARHGAPPLQIDPELQNFAQGYVRRCLGMKHSGKYSENLAGGGPPNPDQNGLFAKSVEMWYNEIGKYNFDQPGFAPATGHFTQVVWHEATKIGCGFHNCQQGQGPWTGWLVSCNYDKGNMMGQFPQNVRRPR